MKTSDPRTVALEFNECINRHDVEGLSALMPANHLYVDREGRTDHSRRGMVRAWEEFFQAFPEYRNIFVRVESVGDRVTMLGYAYWDKDNQYDPAIWVAKIVGGLVAEWRIYYDTDENRKKFGLA